MSLSGLGQEIQPPNCTDRFDPAIQTDPLPNVVSRYGVSEFERGDLRCDRVDWHEILEKQPPLVCAMLAVRSPNALFEFHDAHRRHGDFGVSSRHTNLFQQSFHWQLLTLRCNGDAG